MLRRPFSIASNKGLAVNEFQEMVTEFHRTYGAPVDKCDAQLDHDGNSFGQANLDGSPVKHIHEL